ncbi:hypothetical protein OC842_002908 [Tilletia horrida]|uniref:Uncharacterized protein n=1 Tax=Tilletia horrida TaxID=155126 RepID=A0AAN6JLU3_9BASI|nr:hypothetical protein OC842_002908 [Tilletia horrida]
MVDGRKRSLKATTAVAAVPARRAVATVSSTPTSKKRSARDDENDEGSQGQSEEDASDSDEEDEEDEDDEHGANVDTGAYGLAILKQLGIDPSSVPAAAAASRTPSKGKAQARSEAVSLSTAAAKGKKKQQAGEALPIATAPKRASGADVVGTSTSARRQPETVIFDGAGTSSSGAKANKEIENTFVDSKAARKAFMSSRIERIGVESSTGGKGKGRAGSRDGDDEENAQEKEHKANDRLLSHLLSTTLFAPGADASSSPATKRNGKPALDPTKGTLASILELSTTSEQRKGAVLGRGWGDAKARLNELGKVPVRMREGLKKAAKDRVGKEQERARELGLVHRSLHSGKRKNMGGTGAVSAVDMALSGVGASKKPKDRVRGLGMGVGKFGGGKLTISARDVEKINGPAPSRGGPSRGGRGGGGGVGGGRSGGGGPAKKKQRKS